MKLHVILQLPYFLQHLLLLLLLLALSTPSSSRAQETAICKSQAEGTPVDMLGPFYLPNSPITKEIGPAAFLNDPSKRLTVRGNVLSSISGCASGNGQFLGVPNVTIELWYAGDPDEFGNFYQNEAYRGKFVTNECGEYQYTQTFPALYPTRPILHNHFRLSHQNNAELVVTQMYFVGTNATEGYLTSTAGRQLQAVELTADKHSGERFAEFDFFVKAPGNPACPKNNLATTYYSQAPATSAIRVEILSALLALHLLAGVFLL